MENTELLKFSSNTALIGSKLIHVVFNNAATLKKLFYSNSSILNLSMYLYMYKI